MQIREKLRGRFKGTGDSALPIFFQALHDAAVHGAPLRGRELIGGFDRLGNDGNDPTCALDLKFLPALKPGAPQRGQRNNYRRLVLDGNSHGSWLTGASAGNFSSQG